MHVISVGVYPCKTIITSGSVGNPVALLGMKLAHTFQLNDAVDEVHRHFNFLYIRLAIRKSFISSSRDSYFSKCLSGKTQHDHPVGVRME